MNALRLAVRRSHPLSAAQIIATSSRSYSTSPRLCPSCSTPLPTALPTCPNCFHIEPVPKSLSYFDIFDLSSAPNRFKIDAKDLRFRFLRAQRICHPDAWSGQRREHGMAAAQSSLLNSAYKTLLSPLLRAQYILTQEGFPPSETDKLTDQELIMEVMEAREELDDVESPEDVESIRSDNQGKIEETYNEIETLISEREWERARDAVVKLKYLEGIDSAAKERWHALSR
ncbi:Co-chaperone Hsc20 [Phellopilus nigrolimitatus]|nr:Co-chaperone Hsc20 [Phellopilus nigrolimitatus]